MAPYALVTGASRGIGRAIAESLATAGWDLVLTARDGEELEALEKQLAPRGIETTSVAADLRAVGAVDRIMEAAGGTPDAVVNNAGVAPAGRLAATGDAELEAALDLHVRAPFRLLRATLPAMAERGSGCALQVASSAGLRGFPFTAAYSAAKHGMVGMTRALHEEFGGKGVALYALCPGFVDTAITRQAAAEQATRGGLEVEEVMARMGALNRIGRMHRPEEVAAAVVHLILDRPAGCVYDLDRPQPGFVDHEVP